MPMTVEHINAIITALKKALVEPLGAMISPPGSAGNGCITGLLLTSVENGEMTA